VNEYVTLPPEAVANPVETEAVRVTVDFSVKLRVWLVVGVLSEKGALETTAMGVVDWLTTGTGLEIAGVAAELEAPRTEDEEAPLTEILVVTVEKKVVGKMAAVVKEVSVLVLWEDDTETAFVEGLRSIRLILW
jgi:hypothetical protein